MLLVLESVTLGGTLWSPFGLTTSGCFPEGAAYTRLSTCSSLLPLALGWQAFVAVCCSRATLVDLAFTLVGLNIGFVVIEGC